MRESKSTVKLSTRSVDANRTLATLGGFALVCVFAHGLLIPWLGFYYDEWRSLWVYHVHGKAALVENQSFAARPYAGLVDWLAFSAFGLRPLAWHLFALGCRMLTAFGAWSTFTAFWPGDRLKCAAVALLFLVYPGYTQQPIALIFGPGVLCLALLLLSFASLRWAIRVPRYFWWLYGASLLLACHNLLHSDYFVGLELAMRPVLLAALLAQPERPFWSRVSVRRMLRLWAPFAVLQAAFVVWRVWIFRPGVGSRYDGATVIRQAAGEPLTWIIGLVKTAAGDIVELVVLAWTQTMDGRLMASGAFYVVAWGLIASAACVAFVILWRTVRRKGSVAGVHGWDLSTLLIGVFALTGGMLPFWFSGRGYALHCVQDRFALGGMFGAAILAHWLLSRVARSRFVFVLLVSLLVGFAVGFHFRNANDFRRDWRRQRDLYWQLAWRAPDLAENTAVLLDDAPLLFPESYTITVPVNMLYGSDEKPDVGLRNWGCNASVELRRHLDRLDTNTSFFQGFLHQFHFDGTPDKAIVAVYQPPSSLRVLRKVRDQEPGISILAQELRQFSDVQVIRRSPSGSRDLFKRIFGPEPEHGWAYYFQRAELAAQFGDWRRVAELAAEVQDGGLEPTDMSEWLVFIEGCARAGKTDDSITLAHDALNKASYLRKYVVDVFGRLEQQPPEISSYLNELNTTPQSIKCWWKDRS